MRTWLLGIQAFLAVNAFIGELLLMGAPDGSLLQLPRDFMHSTLFADYFWPGATLFGVIGVGHALGFALTLRRSAWASRAALLLGAATVFWIGAQVLLTELFWLQGVIAVMGMVEIACGRLSR